MHVDDEFAFPEDSVFSKSFAELLTSPRFFYDFFVPKWSQFGTNSKLTGVSSESSGSKTENSKIFWIQNVSKSGSDSESYRYHGYRKKYCVLNKSARYVFRSRLRLHACKPNLIANKPQEKPPNNY